MKRVLCALLVFALFVSNTAFAGEDVTFSTKVVDRDGNVINEMFVTGATDESEADISETIIITRTSERDIAPMDLIRDRQNTAHDTILQYEKVADLPGLEDEFAPEDDMAVRDLFDVEATGQYGEYLEEEENYLNITFNMMIPIDVTLYVLKSLDGITWEIVPESQYTIFSNGTLVLQVFDSAAYAFAARTIRHFAPSAEKTTPTVHIGWELASVVYAEDIPEDEDIENESLLIVTVVEERDSSPTIETRERVDTAYDRMMLAYSLEELVDENGDSLSKQLENAKDLVVRDMFDLTATGACAAYLARDDTHIDLYLETTFAADSEFHVIMSPDGAVWKLCDDRVMHMDEEGNITLRITDPGLVAMVVPAQD